MSSVMNQRGFSLVMVMISVGIMGVVMMGFTSMMLTQNKETKAVAEALAVQDLTKSLILAMSKGDVCKFILTGKTFNATLVANGTPQEIDMGTQPLYVSMNNPTTPGPVLVKKGDQASSYVSSMEVQSIKFKILSGAVSGATSSFVGQWEVHFDSAKTIRSLKPAVVKSAIVADTSNASAAKIVQCQGSGAGTGTANYLSKWSSNTELGDSVIYEDPVSHNIGIGTTEPGQPLTVMGQIYADDVTNGDVSLSRAVNELNIIDNQQVISKPRCKSGQTPLVFLFPVSFAVGATAKPIQAVETYATDLGNSWRGTLRILVDSGWELPTGDYGKIMAIVKCD